MKHCTIETKSDKNSSEMGIYHCAGTECEKKYQKMGTTVFLMLYSLVVILAIVGFTLSEL
tara:strand:+ start:320 stop:499 length:180 start_codon:yes stop_codon:yes gene_type:complete